MTRVWYDTEYEFARLLRSKQFQKPEMAEKWDVKHWEGMLLWISGMKSLKVSNMAVKQNNYPDA